MQGAHCIYNDNCFRGDIARSADPVSRVRARFQLRLTPYQKIGLTLYINILGYHFTGIKSVRAICVHFWLLLTKKVPIQLSWYMLPKIARRYILKILSYHLRPHEFCRNILREKPSNIYTVNFQMSKS